MKEFKVTELRDAVPCILVDSETSVNFYQNTRRNILEDRRENQK